MVDVGCRRQPNKKNTALNSEKMKNKLCFFLGTFRTNFVNLIFLEIQILSAKEMESMFVFSEFLFA